MPALLFSLLSGFGEKFPKRGSKAIAKIGDYRFGIRGWKRTRIFPTAYFPLPTPLLMQLS
jgi:hypothetical protein